ncbi:MAG: hypothetical protein LAO23_19650 [Acidobacteriia bacterium]|nr:hypothetical protein [Terriglobia bacterium]
MIRFLFTVLATLIASSLACAAGGGHSQKFDPNAYGGAANVSCLGPAIAGICATGYDAKCAGGSTDNTVAYTNFVTANISGNAVLYADIGTAVPPQQHSICNDIVWGTTLSVTGLGTVNATPIKKLVIWGYGLHWRPNATGNAFLIGASNVALIQTANVGDTVVTLIDPSKAANYPVGRWVCACGLELQHGGYPPNFKNYQYRLITAVNLGTGQITLHHPIEKQILSTWPLNDILDGPAALWLMDTHWDADLEMHGVHFDPGAGQVNFVLREIRLYDVVIARDDAPAPSSLQSFSMFFTNFGSPEVDKNIETSYWYRGIGNVLNFQSPSPFNLTIESMPWVNQIGGTPQNLTLINSFTPLLTPSPSGFGVSSRLDLRGSFVQASAVLNRGMDKSVLDPGFSAGTFTISKTDAGNAQGLLAWGVPAAPYYFADSDCTNNASPSTTFHITGLRQDGYSFQPLTPLPGASFTGSISGTTLTVTAVSSGTIAVGQFIFSVNTQNVTPITALGTGTGGIGTYTVTPSQTVTSQAMTSAPIGITQGSPATVFMNNHGLTTGTPFTFQQPNGSGNDSLPSPLVVNTQYFVKTVLDANSFTVSLTNGGAAVNTTTLGFGFITLSNGNYYADTDIVGALPTPLCNGHACPKYCPWGATSVTQGLSTGANFNSFQAPWLLRRDLDPASNDNRPVWIDEAA